MGQSRILIVGASGQIGGFLLGAAARSGFKAYGTHIGAGYEQLLQADITSLSSIKSAFEAAKPDVAVLCASLTAVDYCQTHPQEARRINVAGTANFKTCCGEYGAKPVFLSTEYVFDGKAGPYTEEAKPNPLSVYAETKLEGEKIISSTPDFLIARTTVVYSYDPHSLNFAMQLVNRLSAGTEMLVPADQYSNPTYAPELAQALLRLAAAGKTGVYNMVGKDRLSRYEFALKACSVLGFDSKLIKPVATAALNQAAPRPLNAGLVTAKLERELGYSLFGAQEGLERFKQEWKSAAGKAG